MLYAIRDDQEPSNEGQGRPRKIKAYFPVFLWEGAIIVMGQKRDDLNR